MLVRPVVCVAVLILAGTTAAAAPNPLTPLQPFVAALEKGMNDVIKGKDGAKAFAPLIGVARKPMDADLKAAGVNAAQLLAMELELVFYEGDKASYYLRTAVTSTKSGPAFVQLSGRPLSAPLAVKAHPLSAFTGAAAPLAVSASRIVKALSGKKCGSELPLATPGDFSYLPPALHERASKDLLRSRSKLEEECKKLAALKISKVDLRVDDVMFAGLKGKEMVGMIKSGLVLSAGKLTLEYGRFRGDPAKKRGAPPAP